MRNNLSVISFCCIIKIQNLAFTSLWEQVLRFHSLSQVIFQPHVSIFHYDWNLFFKISDLFWF